MNIDMVYQAIGKLASDFDEQYSEHEREIQAIQKNVESLVSVVEVLAQLISEIENSAASHGLDRLEGSYCSTKPLNELTKLRV